MLEIPEAFVIAKQIKETLKGKKIKKVIANHSEHAFAFFFGDPKNYSFLLEGKIIQDAKPVAGQIEITVQDMTLLFGDGTNIRYLSKETPLPSKHQLVLLLDDETKLVCTVQMYGMLYAFKNGTNDNPYYLVAIEKPNPLSDAFDYPYFITLLNQSEKNKTLKAFLATNQTIPGLGNGVLQDILFSASLHPKTKVNSLSEVQKVRLFESVKDILHDMTQKGGRDTEKDLFGNAGKYPSILSSKTYKDPCKVCKGPIIKQAYLGGSIYYCPHCQPLF